ncbi:hypothetical protein OROGR_028583 [Orobanche gracilis]
MSWFARSIANSLKFDDDDDVSAAQELDHNQPESQNDEVTSPTTPSRGVKEDLTELSKTLTRQLWGVASFLAPPPQPEDKSDPGVSESDQSTILGIRSDFAEIGVKFRSGISRLSNNINVSEITKLASNLLQLESDNENEEAGKRDGFDSMRKGTVDVIEEVVAFARDIAMHPETWLNFPLPENDGDNADFDLSDAQQEHTLAVERLAPRLAALRIELCPGFMSESCFWTIYFVLLHPRLNKQDAELLSTPQVVKARALLGHELKNQNSTKPEDLSGVKSLDEEEIEKYRQEEPLSVPSPIVSENESNKASALNIGTSTPLATTEIVKNSVEMDETRTVDNPISEENEAGQIKNQYLKSISLNVSGEQDEDDADDWLKEETTEASGAAGEHVEIPIENEDDVSFSDLEDDDGEVPTNYIKSSYSSDKDSREWVQLGNSSSDKESGDAHDIKESNDWLDIDDVIVS